MRQGSATVLYVVAQAPSQVVLHWVAVLILEHPQLIVMVSRRIQSGVGHERVEQGEPVVCVMVTQVSVDVGVPVLVFVEAVEEQEAYSAENAVPHASTQVVGQGV